MNETWYLLSLVVGFLLGCGIMGTIMYFVIKNKSSKCVNDFPKNPSRKIVVTEPTTAPGRARIYHLAQGLKPGAGYNLHDQKLAELPLELLDQRGLGVSDVIDVEVDGESWLIVSTGRTSLLLHRMGASHIVTTNVDATELAVQNGRLYALSNNKVSSACLRTLVGGGFVEFVSLPVLQAQTVLSLERVHSRDTFGAVAQEGTFSIRNDTVVKRQEAVRNISYGETDEEYAVQTSRGVQLHPNNELLSDIDIAVITAKNELYGLKSTQNKWVRLVRIISGEPVFITFPGATVPDSIH